VKVDGRNAYYGALLVLVGGGLVTRNVWSQETVPLATREELRERFGAVTKALKWPLPAQTSDSSVEEFRVLLGSGTDFPALVVRTLRRGGTATGSAAFWWVRGPYSESIRKSFREGPSKPCKRIAHSGNVEVCDLAEPRSRRDWSSVWDSKAIAEVRSLAFEQRHPVHSDSEGDTVVADIQWSGGSRSIEFLPVRDTSLAKDRAAKAVGCLVVLLFRQAAPEAVVDESEVPEDCH
jgi:hypothetical protein